MPPYIFETASSEAAEAAEAAEVAEWLEPEAAVVDSLDSSDEKVGVTDEEIFAVEVVRGVFDPDLPDGCSSRLATIFGSRPRLCKALESKPAN